MPIRFSGKLSATATAIAVAVALFGVTSLWYLNRSEPIYAPVEVLLEREELPQRHPTPTEERIDSSDNSEPENRVSRQHATSAQPTGSADFVDTATNESLETGPDGIQWTRSMGLTNALMNRRSEFNEFSLDVYEEGLSEENAVTENEEILNPLIAQLESTNPIDGVLFCSASICFYDLNGGSETARIALRTLSELLGKSGPFQGGIAYVRQGPDLYRFYFITERFPIETFYEQ